MKYKSRQEIPEEKLIKALDDLEKDIVNSAGDDEEDSSNYEDDDDKSESDSESMAPPIKKSKNKAKKGYVNKDRQPMRALPRKTREANQAIDDDAGTGESADMSAKSFRQDLRSNGNVRKAMDASSFIEGLCDSLTEEIDSMRKAMLDIQDDQSQFNVKLAKAIVAMGTRVQELGGMIETLGGRPANVRKSVTTQGEVQQRFSKSMNAGGTQERGSMGNEEYQFTREQVLSKACEMAEKGRLPAVVISTYESSGSMDEKFQKSIFNELVREHGGGLN